MTVKAIALLSGGLDSILAAMLVQKQNIDMTGLAFTTPFFGASKARAAAIQIPLPLIVEDITAEHLQMLKAPRYGYGKNMNPCIDCHTLMLAIAGRKMEEAGADFLVTGEVLGQRPMSQTRQSLYVVAKNSGYADYVLRPLSAQLLDPVMPEREGKIDRSQLLAISGRGRKEQMRMAEAFGIKHYPPPAGGCLLTDPIFSRRLRDLMDHLEDRNIRDYELLKYGRHFRVNDNGKIIVGRNQSDNDFLRKLSTDDDLVCNMADFPGPLVLAPYGGEAVIVAAASLCVRYSDAPSDTEADVVCRHHNKSVILKAKAAPKDDPGCRII
ncbi:MAG: putative tRNA (5-methylaminomethyl-2-thiouridylate) -methyltransferase [Deltaproteobacteria bacterium]|nr:putative tRNA (5-methylaminomethyl-2-thiouridylate) -methyltransferase [Deltaproteobacteria bacterium]